MSPKRVLLAALIALAALPATAAAQTPITPPEGDNYLMSIFLNDASAPFPKDEIGFVADTSTYTTQPDMYNPPGSGGPPEPANCGSPYGKTIWSVFYSNRYGTMDVSTAGPFDSVIAVVPWGTPGGFVVLIVLHLAVGLAVGRWWVCAVPLPLWIVGSPSGCVRPRGAVRHEPVPEQLLALP